MTNLFPPIIDSYMPSFAVEDKECKIYFQISNYNSTKEIEGAEISVKFQASDATALKNNKAITTIPKEYLFLEEGYLILKDSLLQNAFEANTIYKIQIRFFKTNIENEIEKSEWSTVCLIKGIKTPSLKVPLFDDAADLGDLVVNTSTIEVQAEVIDLEEEIYFYSMKLEDKNIKEYDYSGEIYTTDANDKNLKYVFKKQLEVNQNYKLTIEFCTTSYYTFKKEYDFVYNIIDKQLDIEILLQEDNDNGYLKAAIPVEDLTPGSYVILRASSLDNFSVWKDIHKFQKDINTSELIAWIEQDKTESVMDGQPVIKFQDSYTNNESSLEPEKKELYIYKDYTVESGVMYKYKIQNYGKGGIRSVESKASAAALCYFNDVFLSDKNFQLKVKYDSSVSGLKRNILETKTDTIGGTYPFIKRNGKMKYESFTVSGIIVAHGDDNEFYDDSWKEDIDWKNTYFNKYDITDANDFIGEKKYRDIVSDFLQNGQIKLFRSTQEGSYLVRLMDVTFTPNTQLGRRIYSFQATAYQIADLTIENYIKYNIIDEIVYDSKQDIISNQYTIGRAKVKKLDDLKLDNIYNINDYRIKTKIKDFNKIRITALENDTEITLSKDRNIKLRHAGHYVDLYSTDIADILFNKEVLIDYDAIIELAYDKDYFKNQYVSFNVGQLITEPDMDIIDKIVCLYNNGIKEKYYQEIEKIDAINFYNFNVENVKVQLFYEDKITDFIIPAKGSYTLTSDKLENNGIKKIIVSKKVYIDYYYTLSKKYYFN